MIGDHEEGRPAHDAQVSGLYRPGESGFQGFKMQLPENCVEYMLFMVDDQIQPRNTPALLETVRKAAVRLCNELTEDYIWQRQEFGLQLKMENGLLYLHGVTDYGDSVEDEWLIVYILRELTRKFENLWVRVADSDGEFLLIEAANTLPGWLNPEMDSNRVWIHDGQLHIIPVNPEAGSGSETLSLEQAVNCLRFKPDILVQSDTVQAEAFYRLGKYPSQIARSLHYGLATIPRKLAYLLHARPGAVAPATEAFYLREPRSLKAVLSQDSELVLHPRDLVTVSVRFTRVLFAQLVSQQFEPPPAWKTAFAPLEEATLKDDGHQKRQAQLDLGMKLTTGFEMLLARAHESSSRVSRELALLVEDLAEDGDQVLPTDEEIRKWPQADQDDDDSWMDINYQDFERELDGRGPSKGSDSLTDTGFGDTDTQTDLRKIVSRFEAFLNDEHAGFDGAEVDAMDQDSDEDEETDSGESEDENQDVNFDEEKFSRLMREMMGLPSDTEASDGRDLASVQEEKDDDDEIQELAAQMESELTGYGALALDPTPPGTKMLQTRKSAGDSSAPGQDLPDEQDDKENDEVDIDYNLAKNLLESFKSQAGVAGPAGNLLGLMGITLPRDEPDADDKDD